MAVDCNQYNRSFSFTLNKSHLFTIFLPNLYRSPTSTFILFVSKNPDTTIQNSSCNVCTILCFCQSASWVCISSCRVSTVCVFSLLTLPCLGLSFFGHTICRSTVEHCSTHTGRFSLSSNNFT